MSKFEFAVFWGDEKYFAANKEKYTLEEALKHYKVEMDAESDTHACVCDGFVRHRAGWNEDNERCVGWWLENEQNSRSCPVYVISDTQRTQPFDGEYKVVSL